MGDSQFEKDISKCRLGQRMEVNLRLLYRKPTASRTVEQFHEYGLRLRSAIANHLRFSALESTMACTSKGPV